MDKQSFIQLYERSVRLLSQNFSYKMTEDKRVLKMVDNFLSVYPDEGEVFYERFITYQFNRYPPKDNLPTSWILGSSAIKKWQTKKDGSSHFVDKKISKSRMNKKRSDKYELSDKYRDSIRKMAVNNFAYAIECIDLKLFVNENKYCKICQNKEICCVKSVTVSM